MGLNYTISNSKKRITLEFKESYTHDDIRAYLKDVWSDPIASGVIGLDELYLFNDAVLKASVDTTDMLKLAEYGNQFDNSRIKAKIALVYNKDKPVEDVRYRSVYAGARNLMSSTNREVKTFNDADEAVRWFEESI